ncbi:MAG: glycosyltransferase family 9 protein [Candidatus Methylomirabilis sp.]|nr:glycosyltransferase family 9 protein [Deltaproteobacteria bacterium]
MNKNILLIQLGDIGDVVLTTPSIRAIKETFPEARVSIMVRKPFGNLLAADPHLHAVLEAGKVRGNALKALAEHASFMRRLRKARYDLVIDLRTGDRGAIMSLLTGARTRVGVHCKEPVWRNLLFTRTVREFKAAPYPVHPGADQSLRILRAIGIETNDSMPRLYFSKDDLARARTLISECGLPPGTRLVTLNPFSRWKYKEWSDQKWGQIIDRLWDERHIFSVLVGSDDESPEAEKIRRGREDHTFNLAGKTNLPELSALISLSSLHLGVDSAAPHIAAAVGTPTLTVFGPGNWKSWTVQDDMRRVVTAEMLCIPCNKKGCDDSGRSRCMYELRADEVYSELESFLKGCRIA